MRIISFNLARSEQYDVNLYAEIIGADERDTLQLEYRVRTLMREIELATPFGTLTTPEEWWREITQLSGCEWYDINDWMSTGPHNQCIRLVMKSKVILFTHTIQLDRAIAMVCQMRQRRKGREINVDEVLGFVLE